MPSPGGGRRHPGTDVTRLLQPRRRGLKGGSAPTNSLELLNKTLKRRTRVAALFPNAGALLRLVSAILIEVSEEWETGKLYLSMECR
jgi:hypothetical protein